MVYLSLPVEHRDSPLPSFHPDCGHFLLKRKGGTEPRGSAALWPKKPGAMASIGSSSLGELYSKCVQMVPWMKRWGLGPCWNQTPSNTDWYAVFWLRVHDAASGQWEQDLNEKRLRIATHWAHGWHRGFLHGWQKGNGSCERTQRGQTSKRELPRVE